MATSVSDHLMGGDSSPRPSTWTGSLIDSDAAILVDALLAEGARARAAAQFEDMGYDDCDTCRRARLRLQFTGGSVRPRARH